MCNHSGEVSLNFLARSNTDDQCVLLGWCRGSISAGMYHMCDSVPAQVEFSECLEASEVGDTGDLIAGQVEYPQVSQVTEALYIMDLWAKIT